MSSDELVHHEEVDLGNGFARVLDVYRFATPPVGVVGVVLVRMGFESHIIFSHAEDERKTFGVAEMIAECQRREQDPIEALRCAYQLGRESVKEASHVAA